MDLNSTLWTSMAGSAENEVDFLDERDKVSKEIENLELKIEESVMKLIQNEPEPKPAGPKL